MINRILGLHGRKGDPDLPEYSAKAIENALDHGGIFVRVFYSPDHRLRVGRPGEGIYHSLGFVGEIVGENNRPFVAIYPVVQPFNEDENQEKFLETAMGAVWRMQGRNLDFGIFSPDEGFLKSFSPDNAEAVFKKAKAKGTNTTEERIRKLLSADKGLLAGGLKSENRDPVEAAKSVGAKFVAVYGKEYNNEEIKKLSETANILGITLIVNIQADSLRTKELIRWAWIIANDPEAAYKCAFPDTES